MIKNTKNKKLLRAILEKAFSHTLKNPEKEIPTLLEAGKLLARTDFQHAFLKHAEAELENPDSVYAQTVFEFIHAAPREQLLNVGLNLGFNSFYHGAKSIRRYKGETFKNLPWLISISFDSVYCPTPSVMEETIRRGLEKGIYCYALIIDTDIQDPAAISAVINAHSQCVFAVSMTGSFALGAGISLLNNSANNTLIMLDIYSTHVSEASEYLQKKDMLFVGYVPGAHDAAPLSAKVDKAAEYGFNAFIISHELSFFSENRTAIDGELAQYRTNPTTACIPYDLLSDTLFISDGVLGCPCLGFAKQDGGVKVVTVT